MNNSSDRSTSIMQLRDRVQKFVEDRDWSKYHNPKNLAMSIAIEAAELMELFQWVDDKETELMVRDSSIFTRLEEELADVVIYCLSLANATSVDIAQAVVEKIEKNGQKYPAEKLQSQS